MGTPATAPSMSAVLEVADALRWSDPGLAAALAEHVVRVAGDDAEVRAVAERAAVRALGELDRAPDVIVRAAPLLLAAERGGRGDDAAALRCDMAGAAVSCEDTDSARALLEPVLERELPALLRSAVAVRSAEWRASLGDVAGTDGALALADVAVRPGTADDALLAVLRQDMERARATARRLDGDASGALQVLRAIRRAGGADRGRRAAVLVADQVDALLDLERVSAARARATETLDAAPDPTATLALGRIRCALAERIHLPAGELDAAERMARAADEDLAAQGYDLQSAHAMALVAAVAEARGDLGGALTAVREAHAREVRAREAVYAARRTLAVAVAELAEDTAPAGRAGHDGHAAPRGLGGHAGPDGYTRVDGHLDHGLARHHADPPPGAPSAPAPDQAPGEPVAPAPETIAGSDGPTFAPRTASTPDRGPALTTLASALPDQVPTPLAGRRRGVRHTADDDGAAGTHEAAPAEAPATREELTAAAVAALERGDVTGATELLANRAGRRSRHEKPDDAPGTPELELRAGRPVAPLFDDAFSTAPDAERAPTGEPEDRDHDRRADGSAALRPPSRLVAEPFDDLVDPVRPLTGRDDDPLSSAWWSASSPVAADEPIGSLDASRSTNHASGLDGEPLDVGRGGRGRRRDEERLVPTPSPWRDTATVAGGGDRDIDLSTRPSPALRLDRLRSAPRQPSSPDPTVRPADPPPARPSDPPVQPVDPPSARPAEPVDAVDAELRLTLDGLLAEYDLPDGRSDGSTRSAPPAGRDERTAREADGDVAGRPSGEPADGRGGPDLRGAVPRARPGEDGDSGTKLADLLADAMDAFRRTGGTSSGALPERTPTARR